MSKLLEEWKPVVGFEGLYEVSDWGNVKSVDRTFEYYHPSAKKNIKRTFKGQILKKVLNQDGYHVVSLRDYNHKGHEGKVHRLVAEAWIPNLEGKPLIDHINGNKIDNRVENIRWATPLENSNNPNTIVNMRGIQNGRQLNRPDVSKRVLLFDSDWNLINEYPSESEACRQLGYHVGSIGKAIKRGVNKVYNNYFRYAN